LAVQAYAAGNPCKPTAQPTDQEGDYFIGPFLVSIIDVKPAVVYCQVGAQTLAEADDLIEGIVVFGQFDEDAGTEIVPFGGIPALGISVAQLFGQRLQIEVCRNHEAFG